MKKIKLYGFMLILFIPFLLGNSPSPYPYAREYNDYTITEFVVTQNNPTSFTHTATLTNTGSGYIPLRDLYYYGGETYYANKHFANEVLMPNKSTELSITHTSEITNLRVEVGAFTEIVTDLTYSNISNITKEVIPANEYEPQLYRYNYEVEITGKTNFRYALITTYTYNGVTTSAYAAHRLEKSLFYSLEDMDESQIEINDIIFIAGRKRSTTGIYTVIFWFAIIVGIIVIGLLITAPVLLIIFFLKLREKKSEPNKYADPT